MASIVVAAFGMGAFATAPAFSQTSEIRIVVNNQVITNNDLQRRAAFLRLQQRPNTQEAATQELIDQMLRVREAQRLNISISDDEVQESYARFASSNNVSTSQLDQILAESGVTRDHFRDYIRAQMSWGRALQARMRADSQGGGERAAVDRMLDNEGERPSATEYILQQVIFVVPAAERGARLGQRRREAEAMRQRFTSCDTTREFARGLIDVTVRDLGRVIEPELPPDWADPIKATSQGGTTQVRDTDRGVEFIAICRARTVSDDRVAQMVLEAEGGSASMEELSETYTRELREAAQITRR